MLYIANDHAGFKLKEILTKYLKKHNIEYDDLGTYSAERVDFPKYAKLLTEKVAESPENKGVLICGTGIGMSIAANRNPKIRAALCKNISTARLARQHNDANVLVLAGRSTCGCSAKKMLHTFLTTEHLGGVYSERMAQIDRKN